MKLYKMSKTKNYIIFGSYPQTKITDNTITSSLTNSAGILPTSANSHKWTSYGYYIRGNTSTDYMWYIDLEYAGEKYRGVYFTSYRPSWTNENSSADNSQQDENGYYTSTVYWFKYEPIKWRILSESGGEALILCEMIIDSQEYCHTKMTFQFEHNGGTGYANNYELSNIRKWLNDTFYNTAFTTLEKELILKTTVDNSERSTLPADATGWNNTTNDYACANTEDYVFLLSMQEVTTSAYGFDDCSMRDTVRRKKNTDYAKNQGCQTNKDCYADNGKWWLRSSYYRYSYYADYVAFDGSTNCSHNVRSTHCGIVPALRIKL